MVRIRGILRKPVKRAGGFIKKETFGRAGKSLERRRAFQEALQEERIKQAPEMARRQVQLEGQMQRKRMTQRSKRSSGFGMGGGLLANPMESDFLFGTGAKKKRKRKNPKRRLKSKRGKKSFTVTFG